jgi:arogenate dehydrogenase (NADP+)
VQALDAAQPFDYELKLEAVHFQGHFLQFLAKTLVNQGHTVLAHSRSDHSHTAKTLGVSFFSDPYDLCEEHP